MFTLFFYSHLCRGSIFLLVNHSCDANAEIQYQHNNSTLSVVATRLISKDEV